MHRYLKTLAAVVLFTLTILPSFYCTENVRENKHHSDWLNVYDTSVQYVGMDACRGCHNDVYETFIQTGMGQSFDHATREKSAADFGMHAVVYDRDLDYYYHPHWRNDSLYILEYRLQGKDTVHKHLQRIDYIIGSGQHTNSHIFRINGYLYQAPVTFYTQKRRWDLAPGFENGANSRFSRVIESECMTCHNAYPAMLPGSQNKYTTVHTGIDCERCHGPGQLHVAEKLAGKIVDTSQTPDYTIVNPRRLSVDLQNNICQRCHLQGISVLKEGKTFFDFRPGMSLHEVMHVFMPQYTHADDQMIMASHVQRMKQSECYVRSGQMSCISCHNPHVSVKFTPKSHFIHSCKSCHGEKQSVQCTEALSVRKANGDDCISCHMPKNGSIDIPHVAITDHFIRRRPQEKDENPGADKEQIFLGLRCYNDPSPDDLTLARAYMDFYERMQPERIFIDSAWYYIERARKAGTAINPGYLIRAAFLKQDFPAVVRYAEKITPADLQDAWTAYRVGEAYAQTGTPGSEAWYERAVALMPYSLDFRNKYGAALFAAGKTAEAEATFLFIQKENPDYIPAQVSLGYLYMHTGKQKQAYQHMRRAQELAPDSEQNLINLAIWYHSNHADHAAKKVLKHLLDKIPAHPQAAAMLEDLES